MGWLGRLFGRTASHGDNASGDSLKDTLQDANQRMRACEARLRDAFAVYGAQTHLTGAPAKPYQAARGRSRWRYSLRTAIGLLTILSVVLGVYFSNKTAIDTYIWQRKMYQLERQFQDEIVGAVESSTNQTSPAAAPAQRGAIKTTYKQILEHERERPTQHKRRKSVRQDD